MCISRVAMVAIAVLFGSICHSTSGYAQWLFTDLPKSANAVDGDAAIDPTILRSRLVGIDWAQVYNAQGRARAQVGGGNALLMNFFQDVVLSAVPDRSEVRSPENFTWHGHIDGARENQVTLVVLDGVMVGNIRAAGRLFQIRYVGDGAHAVREIDESRFPRDGDPIPVNIPNHKPLTTPDPLATDSAARFDVMALYTPAARSAAGGTTAMTALINLAVAETNTAYSRSGVSPRVRLVYSGEVVGYTEVGDFSTDLARLRSTSDGFMDNIHSLRNAFGADMVSLIIEGDGSLCGLGYLMQTLSAGFASSAFSVSARSCATGNYTFGHEMGHNMGLRHDRINDNANGVFPHSHGYVDVTNNFRDIMGVATGCGGCPRIQNFSNPNVTFNGFPTGVSQAAPNSADAAASLNATALTVANWRTQVAPIDFDDDGKSDITVYQTSTGNWFYVRSTLGFGHHLNFGGANFLPVPGDYDGDGETDEAVYDTTNGNWFIAQSTAGFRIHPSFGGAGFIPVAGDYDADGKLDVGVYQTITGNWFIVRSTLGFTSHLALGGAGFVPVPGDYDGDGKTDVAVYQTSVGNWFIAQSTAGFRIHPSFGGAGFIPAAGDYDGDGKIDVAVYQTGTGHWFMVGSTSGFTNHLAFGGSGYMAVAGDYDGDGQTDTAVYHTSTGNWSIAQSTAGFRVDPSFGGTGFVAVLPQVTILRALGLL